MVVKVTSPVRHEPSADSDLSVKVNDASSTDERCLVPTTARTTARQLESHLVGSENSEELGQTKKRRNQRQIKKAAERVTILGPDEGGNIIYGLLAV